MTHTQQADGLSTPINNGMDYMAAQPPIVVDIDKGGTITYAQPPAAPPARRKPVKGKCMCGKYYSAHHFADGRAFCTKDATHVGGGTFTPAPDAPPPPPVEAPQATAGGITQEQAYKLVELADKVVRATEAHYEAIRNLNVTNAARSAAVAEHLAFIDALAGGALVRP